MRSFPARPLAVKPAWKLAAPVYLPQSHFTLSILASVCPCWVWTATSSCLPFTNNRLAQRPSVLQLTAPSTHTPPVVACERFPLSPSQIRHKLWYSTLLVTGVCTSRHFRQVLQLGHLRKVTELSTNRRATEKSMNAAQSCGMKTFHNSGALLLDWSS